jgi:hypothetical protein
VTTFRSITLVIAVLLLAGGALTGIHLLNTNTTAPLPAQLSTPDAGGGPVPAGSVPPVEQLPPAPAGAPAGPAPAAGASKVVPAAPAPRATTAPDRSSGSRTGSDQDSDRWHGGPGQWRDRDPDGFPRRDQYPFRDQQPGITTAQRDSARQQVANAICDRYHLPRERCQIESGAR